MKMAVQCGPITPLCHNGDLRQCCPAHEEENVGMTCFSGRVNVHTCRNSKETHQLHLLEYAYSNTHVQRICLAHMCSRRGRSIAYCEVGEREDGKAIAY